MKVLVLALMGSDGDIHPPLAIAQELKARGHQIVIFCQEKYASLVESYKLQFVSSYDSEERAAYRSQFSSKNVFGKIKYFHDFFSTKISNWFALVASYVDEDTVILDCSGVFISHLIGEIYGTPYLAGYFNPTSLLSRVSPPAMKETAWYKSLPYPIRALLFSCISRFLVDPVFRSFFKKMGRELGRDPREFSFFGWLYNPTKALALFPEWYGPAAKDWPQSLTHVGFPLFQGRLDAGVGPALEEFLNAGDAPIIFTPGTSDATKYGNFFETAIAALRNLGLRAIFLAKSTQQLPSLPPFVHYEKYVPLHLVLPRAKALVHHGGIGTTAQALACGTPQLFVPGRFDMYDNAHIVEELGCGLELKRRNEKGLTESLHYLVTSPEIARNCAVVRGRMESGATTCKRAADIVEEVFSNGAAPAVLAGAGRFSANGKISASVN